MFILFPAIAVAASWLLLLVAYDAATGGLTAHEESHDEWVSLDELLDGPVQS